jgi:hypothetical protein
MTLLELNSVLIDLLEEAGFGSELYLIKMKADALEVHFDHPGAVDYFRKEIESSSYAKDLIFDTYKDGVRHVAHIQMW